MHLSSYTFPLARFIVVNINQRYNVLMSVFSFRRSISPRIRFTIIVMFVINSMTVNVSSFMQHQITKLSYGSIIRELRLQR